MVIPGTYITVRAEGLISAGRISTGIVGTAASGPVGIPITLSGFADTREQFGTPDDFNRPVDPQHPLTLVRALEHLYNNGASQVIAVRVAGPSSSQATFTVRDESDRAVAVLIGQTPGTWGNDIRIETAPAEDDCRIEDEEHIQAFDQLRYTRIVPSAENRLRITRGTTR